MFLVLSEVDIANKLRYIRDGIRSLNRMIILFVCDTKADDTKSAID